MTHAPSRLAAALDRIDQANADDPTRTADGLPYGVHYGRRMSAWLARLVPEAPEPLAIAVRAQHVRRFDIARASYPMDKPGYFQWRNALKDHHAAIAAGIMADLGYAPESIDRTRSIIRKERLKRDPDAQALEDCACLVFLEQEFEAFAAKHDDAKLIDILQKTWGKMSEAGHALALTLVPSLPPRLRDLIGAALG